MSEVTRVNQCQTHGVYLFSDTCPACQKEAYRAAVARVFATVTCCECGRTDYVGPGSPVDRDSGFRLATDPVTGKRQVSGHLCGNCMAERNAQPPSRIVKLKRRKWQIRRFFWHVNDGKLRKYGYSWWQIWQLSGRKLSGSVR